MWRPLSGCLADPSSSGLHPWTRLRDWPELQYWRGVDGFVCEAGHRAVKASESCSLPWTAVSPAGSAAAAEHVLRLGAREIHACGVGVKGADQASSVRRGCCELQRPKRTEIFRLAAREGSARRDVVAA